MYILNVIMVFQRHMSSLRQTFHQKEEFAGRLLKYDVSLDQFRNEMAKPNILGSGQLIYAHVYVSIWFVSYTCTP